MDFTTKTLLRAMKLTTAIMLSTCLTVSARGLSQKITLNEDNAPIQKIFREIYRQSGFQFVYTDQELKDAKPISIHVKDEELANVLKLCFENQPFNFTIDNGAIVVKAEKKSNSEVTPPPSIEINGRVTDKDGHPLQGATILVKGRKIGTTTDAKGLFSLKGLNEDDEITVSYTEYLPQTFRVRSRTNFTVALEHSDNPLDQAQVIAYGKQTERFSVGNVNTVTAATIENQPVNNPLLALEGRVPGVVITQTTGVPGTGVTVRTQGQNSISQGNDPFYVIDGVPYLSQMPNNIGGILGSTVSNAITGFNSQSGNPLNYVNPDDIESITILKDASATAIYGSRAANGAILITTKKGKPSEARLNINLQGGEGQVPHFLSLMNTQQYVQMRNEALKNDGLLPSSTAYDINGIWDTTRYTNWQKTLIGGTARYENFNAALSGGAGNTQYLLESTYHNETSVFPGSFSDQKASVHFSLSTASSDQRFHIIFSGNYLYDNNQLPYLDLTPTATTLAPDAPALHNPDGTINWAPTPSGTSSWTNPLASYTLYTYQNKTSNLVSNILLSYEIIPGLSIKTSLGYTNMQLNELNESPTAGFKPEIRPFVENSAIYGSSNANSWIVEPQVTYTKTMAKGKLDALVGATISQNNSSSQQLYGSGYTTDALLPDAQAASSLYVQEASIAEEKYNALFGRVNYNWQQKYTIEAAARRDGSSRFGPANEFHNFWSAGAAWIFSEEPLVKNLVPVLSYGKIKASYGTTGNSQIGDYQYYSLYFPYGVGTAYSGVTALIPYVLPNPYIQWEVTHKFNAGIDLGFLKDRVIAGLNFFRNRSSNQLIGESLPWITGFSSISENFPATVQNSGIELSLATVNIKGKRFSWKSNLNLTIPNNKLVSFPNLATSTYASSLIIGEPLTIMHAFHFAGVDPATGVFQYTSSQGTLTSNPVYNTDNNVLINIDPRYYGGIENSFSFNGLTLNFLFQFVKQHGPAYFGYGGVPPGYRNLNEPVSVLNRWQKPGDITNMERYNSNLSLDAAWGALTSSDAGYGDDSYIRLKNLSLSWGFPAQWLKQIHVQRAALFALGQNLLTFTRYKGFDPETLSTLSLPTLRVFTIGIKAGL